MVLSTSALFDGHICRVGYIVAGAGVCVPRKARAVLVLPAICMEAGTGFEPAYAAYETVELPILYPAVYLIVKGSTFRMN